MCLYRLVYPRVKKIRVWPKESCIRLYWFLSSASVQPTNCLIVYGHFVRLAL